MLFFNRDTFKNIFGDTFKLDFEDWDINILTLSFSGTSKKYEKDFLNTYFKSSIKPFRLSIALGIVIYAVFFMLDVLLFPDLEKELFIIRFGLVIPMMILMILLSYSDIFKRYMQPIASFAMFFTSLGVIIMVIITAESANNYSYYAGIILILFFGYTIARLRFIYSFVTGWLIILAYEIAAIAFTHTPAEVLVNNNFFFISANFVGMLVAYYLEYTERWNFYLSLQLRNERENVLKANAMLEERVKERTKDLKGMNDRLKREIKRRDEYKKEKSELESHLFQLQKMETVGTLAGGIAHDFNNILTPVLGYSGMVLDELNAEDPLREDVEQIQIAAKRGKTLVQKILTFSRHIDTEKKTVSLKEIVEEAVSLLKVSLSKSVVLKTEYSPGTGSVLADKSQIHQVVMNLMVNASHAMKETGGKLNVSLSSEYVEKKRLKPYKKLKEGNYAVITVSDTGHGMDNETMRRIFEPFYTKKEIGEGTGLGLAVVHGIVKNHNGFIEVVSKSGVGTVFRVYFPERKKKH